MNSCQNQNLLAVDVGGTHVKYGLVDPGGTVVLARSFDTCSELGFEAFLDRLNDHLTRLIQESSPCGLAISTLGIIDSRTGAVTAAADAIPGLAGFPLQEYLERRYAMPVVVENDGNCVALAEGRTGAAQGVRDFLTLAVGTGIGGGAVLNGALYRGSNAAVGEWGCALIDGAPWEEQASMSALLRQVSAVSPNRSWSGEEVFDEFRKGNQVVVKALWEWLNRLAKGIVNLIYSFDPQMILIGGGVSAQGDFFRDLVHEAVNRIIREDMRGKTRIELAKLGNQAGMIGAAFCWRDRWG